MENHMKILTFFIALCLVTPAIADNSKHFGFIKSAVKTKVEKIAEQRKPSSTVDGLTNLLTMTTPAFQYLLKNAAKVKWTKEQLEMIPEVDRNGTFADYFNKYLINGLGGHVTKELYAECKPTSKAKKAAKDCTVVINNYYFREKSGELVGEGQTSLGFTFQVNATGNLIGSNIELDFSS